MSLFKDFLDRRGKNLSRQKANQTAETQTNKEKIENQSDNKELTDDDFWFILEQYKTKMNEANGAKTPEQILEEILEPYTPEQIMQFAERYERLNR